MGPSSSTHLMYQHLAVSSGKLETPATRLTGKCRSGHWSILHPVDNGLGWEERGHVDLHGHPHSRTYTRALPTGTAS
jgi:hypothetical protein